MITSLSSSHTEIHASELRSLTLHAEKHKYVKQMTRQISKIAELPRDFGFSVRVAIRNDHDRIDGEKEGSREGDRKYGDEGRCAKKGDRKRAGSISTSTANLTIEAYDDRKYVGDTALSR